MRVAGLVGVWCALLVGGTGAALAQYVEPLKVLEQSRRDRIETDRRLAREDAAWREKVKAAAEARRKLDAAASAGVSPQGPSVPTPAFSSPVPAASPPAAAGPSPASLDGATASGLAIPPAPAPPAGTADVSPALPSPAEQPVVREAAAPPPPPPPPRVRITVDKASQRMRVLVDGKLRHSWAVSTGRAGYETPSGTFKPLWLAREHYSREWDDAPMPHSIFFTGRGHAIHGSTATGRLGRPASHGCVRLAPSNAAALFKLVQAEGRGATEVTITGGRASRPAGRSRRAEARGLLD